MNTVLKIFLSMSFSGSLLILILLLGKRYWKDKISRQWQYYIWLVVVLRLLLPFGPEVSLLGRTYQAVDQAVAQAALSPPQRPARNTPGEIPAPAVDQEQDLENADRPSEDLTDARPLRDTGTLLIDHAWLVWLMAALGLLIRKITTYQGFVRYIRAGSTPVSDIGLLDQLSLAAERVGVKKPVELCVDPLVSSPLLIGFLRPCIVLPNTDISEKDLQYIFLHELTHCKRLDMFYKWLVQAAVCLHWFDPLVHLMSREIAKACEFSCDEAVLAKTGSGSASDYGMTLLDAMASVGKYKEDLGAVTLGEDKQLLKERLGAIMGSRRESGAVRLLTGALTLCMILGAAFAGVYPAAAAVDHPTGKMPMSGKQDPTQTGTGEQRDYASLAERYYKAGSLPLLQIVFPRLDEEEQLAWLEKIYADENIAFFSVAVRGLDTNSSVFASFAEKVYENTDIVFFSTLADCMNKTELEIWLDRALEDENWVFVSILFNKLDKNDGSDELKDGEEKEWEAAQKAEYQAAGVTTDGKNYYYQGQLVDIFLDIRANGSFYTLDMDPAGTVNIKIVRDADDKITGVAYMTEAEVIELFGDMDDPDDKTGVKTIPVDLKTVAAGEAVFLGEYTLSGGDEISYDISAKTGNRMKVFFTKDGQEDVSYWSVDDLRQPDGPLECIADLTVGPPAATPGTYKLYLQAPDSALGNVRGSISIGSAAGAS